MTKPSDLFKKTGTGGASSSRPSPFTPIPGLLGTDAGDKVEEKSRLERQEQQAESMHGHRIEKGKDPGKGASKTLGGAGGAGGRPKV